MRRILKQIILVLALVWQISGGYAQQTNTGLEDKLILTTKNDFLICNDEGKNFVANASNGTTYTGFKDGTYEIDQGDGNVFPNLSMENFPFQLKYERAGNYTLKFSVLTQDNVKVCREYKVKALGRPKINLEKATKDVQCIGNEITYLVKVYEQNTPGTVYTLYYDDGSPTDVMNNDQLAEREGKFRHTFDHSYCEADHPGSSHNSFVLKLSVTNECNFSPDETTITEFVAEPIHADFTFDTPIPGEACTFEKTRLVNATTGGNGSNCDEVEIFYEWKFGNDRTSTQVNPEITYDEAKDYKIRLIASNKYSCARDTAYGSIRIIERVKADFDIAQDELCVNNDLQFTNRSKGGGRLFYQWTIVPEAGLPMPEIVGNNPLIKDQVIHFNHWGKYKVSLFVSNGCSSDIKDTVITVYENPEIVACNLRDQDLLCPQTPDALKMNMQDYFSFAWNGNPNTPHWTITPAEGVSYESGYGPDSEFPRVILQVGKTYDIHVELDAATAKGVECGDPDKRKITRRIKVSDPRIVPNITTNPIASDGKLDICVGTEITFTNHSTGENLTHGWSVVPVPGTICDPDPGIVFVSGNEASASPVIRFNGYGDYLVTDTLKVFCDRELVQFRVHVSKSPTINYFFLQSAICPDDILKLEEGFSCDFYNNAQKVTWEFTPSTVEFVDGTSATSVFPHVHFLEPGVIYEVKATVDTSVCRTATTVGSIKKKIRVRESALTSDITVTKTSICEGGVVVFENKASDPEGDLKYKWTLDPADGWEITDGNTVSAQIFVKFNTWGTYTIQADVKSYCDQKISDPKEIVVHRNPEVSLRDSAYCPGIVVFDDARVSYAWFNNPQEVKMWEITREDGSDAPGDYVVDGVHNLNSLHPQVDFKRPGKYRVRVTLNHAGCPDTDPFAEAMIHIFDPVIGGDVVLRDPIPLEPDKADVCEGDLVMFTNTMVEEANGLKWEWSMENGVSGGWEFAAGTGSTDAEPQFRFSAYGNYRVKVVTYSTCNAPVEKFFDIIVRGIPEITFRDRMKRVCAGAQEPVDLADYVAYVDRKNSDIRPEWSLLPVGGYSWVPGYDETTELPRIQFTQNEHYTIKLTAYSQCAPGGKQELSSEIDVISARMKSAFSVGKDSVGCVNDPNPYEIQLQNQSEGDSLIYTWSVLQSEGWTWADGKEATSESSKIQITRDGYYDVRLHVTNGCNEDDSVFRLKAFAVPEISIEDITGECEPFHFRAKDRLQVDVHNDDLIYANWTIDENPGYVSEEAAYQSGTDKHSFFPDIDFYTCDYTVKVEYRNRCLTPGEATFQVKVDKFIPIEPLDDGAICELAGARELAAFPEGGYWTLKEAAMPGGEKILYSKEGKYYFEPAFTAYEEKDVELVYHFQNLSCIARDTMNMHVWPLPYVEAGDPLEMCLNHEPVLLVGKDSVANGNWQSNRGRWTLGADALEQHYFKAVTPGDFRLEYEYTYEYSDGTGCRNIDTTIMTVRELPNTGFAVNDKNCINLPVLFTPNSPANNQFEWSFGDNTTGQSEDTITHLYNDYGFHEIICRAENQYHCKDTSEPKQIEIVNLPPPAFFDVDTLNGCAPFEVNITVDRSVYADDHNYLSFHWDYGEETVTDTLGPIVPKFYPSGVWDTTYVTTFTVSNMCGTAKYDTTITVYSVPKVSFALMHEWECAPVMLELQNTTTGNNCIFDWTFVNKRTDDTIHRSNVRNPQYTFDTDSASTTYYIRLRAENKCNEDTFTDSLVVKPRSISAHFTPLENPYACVNQEILFRNNSSDTVSTILNTYWNFGDGERTNEWSPSHKYDAAGTYLVSLKIDNGCGWDTISSPVNIFPLPRLEIRSEDVLCEADTFTFVLKSDQELEHIEWKFGDGNRAYKDSLQYVYDGYGTFPVTVIGVSAEINQCTDSTWKEVVVNNKPIVTILPQDTMQCSPLLYAPQVTGDALLMWDYGDGTGQTSAQEHWYENPTDTVQKFQVKIYAETDKGCKSEYERHVAVYNNPRAALDKKVEKGNPQKVTFLNLSEEYTDCIWDLPFKGTLHSLDDQVVEFANNGTYTVGLIVESYHKCRDTTSLEHEVLIKGLYFPNTFIPHSVNGKINRFNGIGMGLLRYRLAIFDQYNNKIWETQALQDGKPSEGWDGCNAKGERMPQGIYIWRAEAIFGDDDVWTGKNNESGVPETTQGTVLLLRE